MRICVINGSPKGNNSVTIQTIFYLKKIYKNIEFNIFNVSEHINKYLNNMKEIEDEIVNSDLLLFAYPVYTFLLPYQLHIFIEGLKDSGINLRGRYVSQITTSKHFYDFTAHAFIKENMQDLGMKYINGLSLDMDDLITKKGQKYTTDYFNTLLYNIDNDVYEIAPNIIYKDIPLYQKSLPSAIKSVDKKCALVCDLKDNDTNLRLMIEDFIDSFKYECEIINLNDFKFKGGCIGCFRCAGNGKCIYKDGFDTLLREKIQNRDAIILAFSIKNHSMGSLFKLYDDRQFCNGHRTLTEGMPYFYIVNGDYENEDNLKCVIEARADVGNVNLCGVGYNNETLAMGIKKLEYMILNRPTLPRMFYGVGGMNIFRDIVYVMRGLMKADHLHYKKTHVYDTLPHKHKGRMLFMMLIGRMSRSRYLQRKMGSDMNKYILAPYKKVIDNVR